MGSIREIASTGISKIRTAGPSGIDSNRTLIVSYFARAKLPKEAYFTMPEGNYFVVLGLDTPFGLLDHQHHSQ